MKFTINGKTYTSKPFDFNFVAELDEQGISLDKMGGFSMLRAYFAYVAGLDKVTAGKELNAHFVSGKNFDELSKVLEKEIEESDFFRILNKTAEEKSQQTPAEETEA